MMSDETRLSSEPTEQPLSNKTHIDNNANTDKCHSIASKRCVVG